MKYLIFIFLTCLISLGGTTQGIEFFHGNWEEALAEAKSEDKIIFVDAFTTWCGPCKRMAANVFPDENVGEFYNANFLNVKMDMEKGEGRKIRSEYKVASFPTLLFVDGDGKLVHREVGAREAAAFINLGKKALKKVDYSAKYKTQYDNGDRSPALVYNYVKALNKSKKSSMKVSNEYLRSQTDKTSPDNLKFIHEAAVESDSRIFDMMLKNKKAIVALVGQEAFNKKVLQASKNTVAKAIEFKSEDLLKQAQKTIKSNYAEMSKSFTLESNMDYFSALGETNSFLKASSKYESTIKNDGKKLDQLSMKILSRFSDDESLMKYAQELSSKAVKLAPNAAHYINYTKVLYKNGHKDEALKAISTAIDITKKEGKPTSNLSRFKQMIERS